MKKEPRLNGAAAEISIGLFRLVRDVDVSGVSGTGVVAHGAVFPNGRAVLSWCVPDLPQSTGVYASFADLCAIHLHGCCTRVEWIYADQETMPTSRPAPAPFGEGLT